uniref:Histone acetyltransferase type B catalytic subunit n=1 Tax=Parastrongyloides trichosuri TaxID=131310 RepID=A0A0N4Z9A7_PARTI
MATIPEETFKDLTKVIEDAFSKRLAEQEALENGQIPDSQIRTFTEEQNEWVSDALKVINIHMVKPGHNINDTPGYLPLFVHQFFPDEKIFGYKDLKVDLYFCASTMYFHTIVSYKETSKDIITSMEPDNILKAITSELPEWHMEVYKDNLSSFEAELKQQMEFKPYGEVICKFSSGESLFELWGPPKDKDGAFDNYVNRIQVLALFNFETGDYTDNDDEKFQTYILYSVTKKPENDDLYYTVAGYSTVYRYYVYPENIRPRIAHFLLTPEFRGQGIGPKFLKSLFNELKNDSKVVDITIEDPSDFLIYCRDYVDCINLKDHPEFSPEKLKMGFSKAMLDVAHEKYKMNQKQIRRVYEILRLYRTDETDKEDMKAYRIDVKRRLEKPMKRTKKELNRLAFLAMKDKHYISSIEANTPEVKQPQLQKLFEKQIEEYHTVLNRLKKYENF